MRAVKLLLAIAVVAVGGTFAASSALSATPAKAKAAPISCDTTVYHPSDNSWSCASGPAGWYHACDYDADGHRVRAWIDTVEPTPDNGPDRMSAWAPSQGCSGWEGVSYGGVYILRIKTCTEGEGCSAWKQVH